MTSPQETIKNLLERCTALALLLVAAPVMIAVAVWIKLSSRGPVLFRQERIGKDLVPFRINKFRTMCQDAERHALGSVTVANDPRLIAGGGWLRKSKIDELPQLLQRA